MRAIPPRAIPCILLLACAAWFSAAHASTGLIHPNGLALDKEGRPTTDPNTAATLTPMSGPKGAGLSLMIEALTSVALGNPLIASALNDRKLMGQVRQNSLIAAMDLSVLGDVAGLKQNLASLAQSIKAEPRAEGFDEILMPGERGTREYEKRMREGIPIAAKTWAEVNELATKLGVAPPQERAA